MSSSQSSPSHSLQAVRVPERTGSSPPAPVDTRPVDFVYRFVDAMLLAVVVDRCGTCRDGPIIVDDRKAAADKFRIQTVKCVDRRFVKIAIEANDREFACGNGVKRIFEKSRDEAHAV